MKEESRAVPTGDDNTFVCTHAIQHKGFTFSGMKTMSLKWVFFDKIVHFKNIPKSTALWASRQDSYFD